MTASTQNPSAPSVLPRLVKGEHRILPRTDYVHFIDEERERADQRQALIERLLADREQIIAEADEMLEQLGYTGPLDSRGSRGKVAAPARNAEAPCRICGFRTSPPHDARSHKAQADKQPFTAEELRQRKWDRTA